MHVMIMTDPIREGAKGDELDTLAQVQQVRRALRRLGHSVEVSYFSLNLTAVAKRIKASGCDFVFNLVENLPSTRLLHLVPLICETIGIPYSGGSSTTLSLSADKVESKRLLTLADLPTAPWLDSPHRPDIKAFINTPLIIKPRAQEASVGIGEDSVRSYAHLRDLRAIFDAEDDLFAEVYIDGREFNLSILPGSTLLPPAEMLFIDYPKQKHKVVGYAAKWDEHSFEYLHTRRTFSFGDEDRALVERLGALALSTYELFGASGYARVDMRVDAALCPYILELNSNPCIAGDSGFVAAASEAGYSYEDLIEAVIQER